MTKIVATLAWYSESPAMLARCVRSLEGIADELIAVDGRWRHFNEEADDALSSDEEVEAIERAADEIGLPRMVIRMDEVWESQVAKRTFMCEAAAAADADWTFIIDADEYIEKVDVSALRGALETTPLDAVMIMHRRGAPALQNPQPIRRLYRTSTGVHCEIAHSGYRTKDGRWLQGDHAYVVLEPCLDLSAHLLLHHPVMDRSARRRQMAVDFYMERRRLEIEKWPAPVASVRA